MAFKKFIEEKRIVMMGSVMLKCDMLEDKRISWADKGTMSVITYMQHEALEQGNKSIGIRRQELLNRFEGEAEALESIDNLVKYGYLKCENINGEKIYIIVD